VVAFVDAEHDDDVVAAGGGGNCVGDRARDDDRVFVETDVVLACRYGRIDEGEIRIPGDEGFGENDQVDAFTAGLGDSVQDFVYGATGRFEVGDSCAAAARIMFGIERGPVAMGVDGRPLARP
jgi:hypothetical protein